VLAEVLAMVDETRERCYEAELYRLKGELTLQQLHVSDLQGAEPQKAKDKRQKVKFAPEPRPRNPDPQGEAEACFLKAIEIAQSQKAKSWELRATASLARLWQQQGKKAEAHKMLTEVYLWFTEGFDTKDLQEVKALLDALA
jgi:predicted ATPase